MVSFFPLNKSKNLEGLIFSYIFNHINYSIYLLEKLPINY